MPAPFAETPADSAAVRRVNLARALRHIAEHGPCSRSEVSAATGLAHGSLTALTADLIDRGLVREAGLTPAGGRGRPRRQLELVPRRVLTLAVRITRERLQVAVADLAGAAVHRASLPHRTPQGDPRPLARAVADALREARAAALAVPGAHLWGAVTAMPGPVAAAGAHAFSTDFGWPGPVDLAALVREELRAPSGTRPTPAATPAQAGAAAAGAGAGAGAPDPAPAGAPDATAAGAPAPAPAAAAAPVELPLVLVNDANLAALAEYRALVPRRGTPPRSLAYLKADIGVGGGLVLDGRIHTGGHGVAGEPGHMPVVHDGPPCACGGRGCLALYVGPEALTDAAGLGRLRATNGPDAALEALGRALEAGERRALDALDGAGEVLGAAVLAVTSLLDVDEFVLGGYLADWYPWLERGLTARLSGRRALAARLVPQPVAGVLGAEAALAGAVTYGRDAVLDDPAAVPSRGVDGG
ncbi:ROK family protein [Streptomyces sp. NPDC058740]|uniref:ROK family protein n=1 Tax=Streptomyces sp. NPDC058740 TaxID=3346619 RepID=UPI0036A67399